MGATACNSLSEIDGRVPPSFKDANGPLIYCTIGDDPFPAALDASLKGKTIETRAFRARHFKHLHEIRSWQIPFIGRNEQILTWGKQNPFRSQRGNRGTARLKMSSQLPALANTVIGGQRSM